MKNEIDFNHTGTFYTLGNPKAKNILVVLHGYGQLASYFIEKFKLVDQDQFFIVAPEGLHHFYLNGTNGRVGASWMTKEQRETDIKNYIKFLDVILGAVMAEHKFDKKYLLGFSQGGATASRYMILGKIKFDSFLLWAAVFPKDMENAIEGNFQHSKNFFIVGSADEYYKAEDIEKLTQSMITNHFPIEFVKFEGNHTIDSETLNQILNEN